MCAATQDNLNPLDNPVSTDLVTWYTCICYIRSSLLQNNIRQTTVWPRGELFPLTWSCTVLRLRSVEAAIKKEKKNTRTFQTFWMELIDVWL